MKMPPVTPHGVLRELVRQPHVCLRIARGWMVVGTLLAVFGSAFAVAHFVFNVSVQDNDTGVPATSGEIILVTSALAGGGLLFLVMGLLLRRWLLGRPNGD